MIIRSTISSIMHVNVWHYSWNISNQPKWRLSGKLLSQINCGFLLMGRISMESIVHWYISSISYTIHWILWTMNLWTFPKNRIIQPVTGVNFAGTKLRIKTNCMIKRSFSIVWKCGWHDPRPPTNPLEREYLSIFKVWYVLFTSFQNCWHSPLGRNTK
jgi:hypothetical protein